MHTGVYSTARSPLTFEQRAVAAVLACGPGATLGDGWAAGLWRVLAEPPGPPEVRRSGDSPHRTDRTQPEAVIARLAATRQVLVVEPSRQFAGEDSFIDAAW